MHRWIIALVVGVIAALIGIAAIAPAQAATGRDINPSPTPTATVGIPTGEVITTCHPRLGHPCR